MEDSEIRWNSTVWVPSQIGCVRVAETKREEGKIVEIVDARTRRQVDLARELPMKEIRAEETARNKKGREVKRVNGEKG